MTGAGRERRELQSPSNRLGDPVRVAVNHSNAELAGPVAPQHNAVPSATNAQL
jgi:hypothetical protein